MSKPPTPEQQRELLEALSGACRHLMLASATYLDEFSRAKGTTEAQRPETEVLVKKLDAGTATKADMVRAAAVARRYMEWAASVHVARAALSVITDGQSQGTDLADMPTVGGRH